MRSLIIIEVEHGENTDLLDEAAREAQSYINDFDTFQDEGLTFTDYAVRVDLPARFHMNPLDSLIPSFDSN